MLTANSNNIIDNSVYSTMQFHMHTNRNILHKYFTRKWQLLPSGCCFTSVFVVNMQKRADVLFLMCNIQNCRLQFKACPEIQGVIIDKRCFIIVLHLVIKPADITSVGCMFQTNAFPPFYSLLLFLFLSAYPPNCCFHPCFNQLDSQVSTFIFFLLTTFPT